MSYHIECFTSKDEIFHAHNIDTRNNKNFSRFTCGICMRGKIIFNKVSNNINKEICDICGCLFELSSD